MLKKLLAAMMVCSLVAGCASPQGYGAAYEPVVDVRAGQYPQFKADLTECQAYANRVMSAAESAVAGAVAGALIGVLFGAVTHTSRNQLAGVGALSGGLSGAGSGEMNQRAIISRCLAGRGYNVLN